MKHKPLTFIITLLFAALSLASCNDDKLAREIEGNWKVRATNKTADGETIKAEVIRSFTLIDDDTKDGGIYLEKTECVSTFSEDDYDFEVRYTTTVNGEYEFIAGDLYLTYDVHSLNVSVDDVKVKLSDDASFSMWFSVASFNGGVLHEIKRNVKKETKEQLYHDSFVDYKSWNDANSFFGNVEINGDELLFDTEDFGRVTCTRIKQM